MTHKVILLKQSGETDIVEVDHKDLNKILQTERICFCGALYEHNAFALCKFEKKSTDYVNVFTKKFPQFFEKAYGDILIVGSDENGDECNIDIDVLLKIFI